MTDIVRCRFYEQVPAKDQPGKFDYKDISPQGWSGSGLPTSHPPAIGDLIYLPTGWYRVIDRVWTHAEYGSAYWRNEESTPNTGPRLDVLLQAEPGLFRDAADRDDDDE